MGKHIHFMGIGGSGMSAVAQIAKAQGYEVTGCDQETDTPYLDKVKRAGIKTFVGHSADHLAGTDILAVTPAVFYLSNTHPEVEQAREKGILMKWQDFLGNYLHEDKTVICVAGTHGKSTTTALAGLLLEDAGLDPTVEVGATVKKWHNNVRLGNSKYFVSEADEFHDNFRTYHPDILILTMIEFDHPEFFHDFETMLTYYRQLVARIKPGGTIIYNSHSPGNIQLIKSLDQVWLDDNAIDLKPYSLSDFNTSGFSLAVAGNHNRLNAQSVILLAKEMGISDSVVRNVLSQYSGLERRMDLLGEKSGITVIDDYANHPSSFAATLSAVKDTYPDSKILAVIEPHTFSRLRSMSEELPKSVQQADQVIVSKIFASRESDPGDFTGQDIVNSMHHENCQYIAEFPDIVTYIANHKSLFNVILIMGSGNSYKLAREIYNSL